jgi:hypothetical protein
MNRTSWCWLAGLVLTSCAAGCCLRTAPSSCEIGDTIYPGGTVNPGNPCQTCQPALNPLGWSAVSRIECDGGQPPDAGPTDAGPPDAGPPDAGPPDAGPPTSCTIGGLEYANGALNPANACQSCQLLVSLTHWANLPEGSSCADGGICLNGACDQGCLIDGGAVSPGANDPGGCRECMPAKSPTSWTELPDGTACGSPSAPNVCYAGACKPGCIISGKFYAPGDSPAANQCQGCLPSVSTSQWFDWPDGFPCGDGGGTDICCSVTCKRVVDDPANCGYCGNQCSPTQQCLQARCE